MRGVETILFLVVLGTVVAAFAGRLRVPAPALLVIAGLIVGLLPGVPPVRVTPDLISLLVVVVVVVVGAAAAAAAAVVRGQRGTAVA